MGLRKGEIHALKWSDIDGDYLNISRSITQKIRGEYRETAPKNQTSVRSIQIPKPLLEILQEHKNRHKTNSRFTDDFRICRSENNFLSDTSIQNRNKKYSLLANLKTIRIHNFRHSHASLLASQGINIQIIAKRLGHSKIEETLNTYAHFYPREAEKAIDVLNQM